MVLIRDGSNRPNRKALKVKNGVISFFIIITKVGGLTINCFVIWPKTKFTQLLVNN